jgi:hypothetical protein
VRHREKSNLLLGLLRSRKSFEIENSLDDAFRRAVAVALQHVVLYYVSQQSSSTTGGMHERKMTKKRSKNLFLNLLVGDHYNREKIFLL